MDDRAPGRPAQPSVLLRAATMMLDELAEKRRREHALDRRLRGTRIQIAALLVPLTAALGALDARERDTPRARLVRIEAAYGPAPRRLGGTPASEALLGYLAVAAAESVTVGEVQAHLARAGLAPRRRYAALTLNRLHGLGVVSRSRFATYTVHRYHPELVARRLQRLGETAPPGDPGPARDAGHGEGEEASP